MMKTYKITPQLRWKMLGAFPILQQAWQCIEDGSFEWRDVEFVKEEE